MVYRWVSVFFAIVFIFSCEDKIKTPQDALVKGYVTDSLLQPIPEAKVITIPSVRFVRTDSSGFFSMELFPRPYAFRISKESEDIPTTLSDSLTTIDTVITQDTLGVTDTLLLAYFYHIFKSGTIYYLDDTTDTFNLQDGQVLDLDTLIMTVIDSIKFDTFLIRVDTLP